MRRLVYDLEVSPNTCLVWRAGYKIVVTPDSIIQERKIISVAWSWVGESKIHALTWDKNQDDKTLLRQFAKVLEESDEAIAYFGDSYDMPFFRARCLIQGVRLSPDIKTVDPLKWARRKFMFNSCKLTYLGKILGVGEKMPVNFRLWKDILLHNCPKALAKMVKYNRRDITLLKEVWRILSEASPVKSHAGVLAGGEKWSCPRCESEKVYIQKTKFTAAGTRSTFMQCKSCYGFFSINDKTRRDYETEMKRRKK